MNMGPEIRQRITTFYMHRVVSLVTNTIHFSSFWKQTDILIIICQYLDLKTVIHLRTIQKKRLVTYMMHRK